MPKKEKSYLKNIYSKLLSDLTLKEYLTYYYYILTFRRQKLYEMWADDDQELKEKELLRIIKQMDSEFDMKIHR
jgi:hypothetical protein|tara:strand:+ start:328 stop:549 length:222 start_codon:yes stop_codon:yes gene_type:complete